MSNYTAWTATHQRHLPQNLTKITFHAVIIYSSRRGTERSYSLLGRIHIGWQNCAIVGPCKWKIRFPQKFFAHFHQKQSYYTYISQVSTKSMYKTRYEVFLAYASFCSSRIPTSIVCVWNEFKPNKLVPSRSRTF